MAERGLSSIEGYEVHHGLVSGYQCANGNGNGNANRQRISS